MICLLVIALVFSASLSAIKTREESITYTGLTALIVAIVILAVLLPGSRMEFIPVIAVGHILASIGIIKSSRRYYTPVPTH
jgi:xanthine/uracil/vitamin C permease (AzgA family)